MVIDGLYNAAVDLLRQLIAIPSYSRQEDKTAALLIQFLQEQKVTTHAVGNNIFTKNTHYTSEKPTLLLNSHHDTVKPNHGYTRDPFLPEAIDGKLYGLGSNDAGGCLVALIATFLYFKDRDDLPFNVVLAASAEEEISGKGGIELVLPALGNIDFAIVGEPTQMQLAVAERGLMVIDALASGKAGHAARNEGENALYKALEDIAWIKNFAFEKDSPLLGPSRMSVTVIETDNKQHNVVPAQCRFTIDVRVNELYSFEEVVDILKENIQSELTPRSMRLRSTAIAQDHPLVRSGLALGKTMYGSPTTSDKALMPFPALKMGSGDSSRSHTADEYIYLEEIRDGIETYVKLIEGMKI